MKRRLFTIVSVSSLTLALLLLLLWPRSHWKSDAWGVTSPAHEFSCHSNRGSLTFILVTHRNDRFDFGWRSRDAGDDLFDGFVPNVSALGGTRTRILGIGRIWCPVIGPEPGYTDFHLFRLPYPWLISIAAVAPVCWLRGVRKRSSHLMCKECGYDLRATPDRCPECGHSVA